MYEAIKRVRVELPRYLRRLLTVRPLLRFPPQRLVIVGNALRVPIWIEPPKKSRDDLVRNLPWYERRRKKRKLDMGNRENESLPTGADSSQLHA